MTNQSTNLEYTQTSIEQRVDELSVLSEVVYQFIDVKRATMRHGRYETDGEHTLHLQMLATSYAAEYYPQLDSGKIARYAMVHDFVEVFAGDVNSLTATPEQLATKGLTEKIAFDRLQRELGPAWPSLMGLVHDYELLKDAEARFVK
ncbi:MAG TPA: HD domain-containing protein, partial [Candidatus Saccharimonadales bacterium]|nr:HD domain-containing protein [Candidatus Saccharimonadales bacterium]